MDAIRVFRRALARGPDRTFAFDGTVSVTYAEADARSDAVASELVERGVSEGRPLGLCSPDSVSLFVAILGAWKAGSLPALVDARTRAEDLPYFVGDIGAKLACCTPEKLHERLEAAGASELVDLATLGEGGGSPPAVHGPDSPLYLSYTSGTTGRPKGAVLSSGPVTLGTACIAERLGLSRDDLLLATTPTSSSFQLVAAFLPAIHLGATIGLVAGQTVDQIWETARRTGATVLVAYPLTLTDVVNAPQADERDTPFRLALSGGSPLAPRIKRDYRGRLGIPLLESYGQSELGGFMALGRPGDDERALAGFVGPPLPDRLACVVDPELRELPPGDVGEVVVTEGYFAGYWNMPDATASTLSGGVLHTGDLGTADPDGYLRVLGRTREREAAVRRGGFLREIEDALYEHPDVQHAAVISTAADEVEGYVELRPGRAATTAELSEFAAERVGVRLRPARIVVLVAMPRSFSGKADRRRLEHGAMA